MKFFKYALALVAILAATFTFSSCDKDVDVDVDAKNWYFFDFELSNKGSLTDADVKTFDQLVSEVIYNGDESTRYPVHCTSSDAWYSFNTIKAKGAESDIQTKIVNELAAKSGKSDFTVTMTLSECSVSRDRNENPIFTKGKELAHLDYQPK